MLHPAIQVKKSRIQGKGLFATRDIPKGTIVWKFSSARVYDLRDIKKFKKRYQRILDHYGYSENGKLVYLTEDSKYCNHNCDANTADAGSPDFNIAIYDIRAGEEVTYDYGFIMADGDEFICHANEKNCRHRITKIKKGSSLLLTYKQLQKEAKQKMAEVPQSLLKEEDQCPCGLEKKYKRCHGK